MLQVMWGVKGLRGLKDLEGLEGLLGLGVVESLLGMSAPGET